MQLKTLKYITSLFLREIKNRNMKKLNEWNKIVQYLFQKIARPEHCKVGQRTKMNMFLGILTKLNCLGSHAYCFENYEFLRNLSFNE